MPDSWALQRTLKSVDDRISVLSGVRKDEIHRVMFLFMLSKMNAEVSTLKSKVSVLQDIVDEVRVRHRLGRSHVKTLLRANEC